MFIEGHCLVAQLSNALAGRGAGAAVKFVDEAKLLDHRVLKRGDRPGKTRLCRLARFAQPGRYAFGLARHGASTFAQCAEGFLLDGANLLAIGLRLGTQCGEPFRNEAFDPRELALEASKRRADIVTEPGNPGLALGPCNIEPRKSARQPCELVFGGPARAADLVGNIAGRVGDHRQIVAQPVHVAERGFTGGGNGFDLGTVIGNQCLKLGRIGRKPFGGNPAERLEIAGLGGEKLPGEAEFAVHDFQAFLQGGALAVHQRGGRGKAVRLGTRGTHGEQPHDTDQCHWQGPRRDPLGPLRRACASLHRGQLCPDEKPGPAGDGQQCHCRRRAAEMRACLRLVSFRSFVFGKPVFTEIERV